MKLSVVSWVLSVVGAVRGRRVSRARALFMVAALCAVVSVVLYASMRPSVTDGVGDISPAPRDLTSEAKAYYGTGGGAVNSFQGAESPGESANAAQPSAPRDQVAAPQSQREIANAVGPSAFGAGVAAPKPHQGEFMPQSSETARYDNYSDNPVKMVSREPLSTFGLDVNTTSYSNVRRFLNGGRLPNPDAVRVEEIVNYFPANTSDPRPKRLPGSPFSVAYEIAPCPWNGENSLLWMSVTASGADYSEAPPVNLVFLVDVSGSMAPPNRLPLARSALKALVANLRPKDKISIVTYAGYTAVALEATPASDKERIISAIDGLGAGGGTAGAAGLALAYEQARKAFIDGGVNRIMLCTDGDFNVGVSSASELEAMVKRERESGVTLSVLGFGADNLNDAMMTRISGVGNGNYSYVDTMSEARKILDEEMNSTLVTVAKDVKAQIEFNPANVAEYRQIGYEKRRLRDEDFNDDAVDAGDVGSGRRVTILYELTPPGARSSVDPLRYQSPDGAGSSADAPAGDAAPRGMREDEIAYVKFRWKEPDGDKSSLVETPIMKGGTRGRFEDASAAFRFFAASAAYGQKLRDGAKLSGVSWEAIASWADGSRGDDPYRAEFAQLVKLAGSLSGRSE